MVGFSNVIDSGVKRWDGVMVKEKIPILVVPLCIRMIQVAGVFHECVSSKEFVLLQIIE